jgi:hypothetical protein
MAISLTSRIAVAIALTTLGGKAWAQAPEAAVLPANSAQANEIAEWGNLLDRLRELSGKMMARLPAEMQRDPQIQQEVARLMLESLAAGTIGAVSHDADRPVFLPSLNLTLNIGQPNADTIYKQARIAPGGTYRLRGRKGNVRIARIGQLGADPSTPARISVRDYNDINTLPADADGSYHVILSPQRPAGYTGAWWRLDPQTSELLLRLVAADWGKERDPTISIERLDAPATKPRVTSEVLQIRLAVLPDAVERMAILLVDHAAKLVAEGYVNRMKVFDVSQIGGQLTGQFYYEGAYDLADDEALIVEAKVPDKCLYYSMILTNMIYETTDWYNNHSSLNDSQLHVDDDGFLRVVISARDPGVANWLDTAGHAKGVVQGRWTECSAQPVPGLRKVKIDQVMRSLPANTPKVSPQEREQHVRDRRAALQQRNLW